MQNHFQTNLNTYYKYDPKLSNLIKYCVRFAPGGYIAVRKLKTGNFILRIPK